VAMHAKQWRLNLTRHGFADIEGNESLPDVLDQLEDLSNCLDGDTLLLSAKHLIRIEGSGSV